MSGKMAVARTMSGPIDAVPCPACGKRNDFRKLDEQQLLDTGSDVECDECGRIMQVAAIRMVKAVQVRSSPNQPNPPRSPDSRRLPAGR